MLEAGLVASRFVHYAVVLALFGLAVFPLYTYSSRVGDPPARLIRWLGLTLPLLALLALLTGVAWYVFVAANMAGSLVDRDALWSVFTETSFGKVWAARLALATLLLAGLLSRIFSKTHPTGWFTPLLSALILVSLAGIGHTQVSDGTSHVVHVVADGAHLVAAGAWLGGLLALGYLLAVARRSSLRDDSVNASTALRRFSGMGSVAVAVLLGSGLINSWFLVGSFATLTGTPYGQLLLGKLCLFIGMLALAGLNRFWLVPSLARERDRRDPGTSLLKLRHHVLGEQALGLCIILSVSLLGTLHPAISASAP